MKLINLGSRTTQEVNNFRFRPTRMDHLLELAAFLPVLANWIYILYRYREAGGDLPSELYASGVSALVIFLLLGVTGYCPLRYINFPFRVGPHNVAYQCALALRMIRVLNILSCLHFLFVSLSIYHPWANIGEAVSLGLLTLVLVGYMVLAWRHK